MAIGCGPKLSKCILILFNLVFWLSGLIMIVVAAITMSNVEMKHVDSFLNSSSRSLLIGILTVGIIIFVIAFCGCCGAIKESKMLLGIYIFSLVLIICVQIAIGIFTIVMKNSAEKELTTGFLNQFTVQYGNNSETTNAIDQLQNSLKCCGFENKNDWDKSKFYLNTKQLYPASCCTTKNSTCWIDKRDVHELGCRERIKGILASFAPIIIGVVLGIAFFEIFVVICAFCLCRNTGTMSETV